MCPPIRVFLLYLCAALILIVSFATTESGARSSHHHSIQQSPQSGRSNSGAIRHSSNGNNNSNNNNRAQQRTLGGPQVSASVRAAAAATVAKRPILPPLNKPKFIRFNAAYEPFQSFGPPPDRAPNNQTSTSTSNTNDAITVNVTSQTSSPATTSSISESLTDSSSTTAPTLEIVTPTMHGVPTLESNIDYSSSDDDIDSSRTPTDVVGECQKNCQGSKDSSTQTITTYSSLPSKETSSSSPTVWSTPESPTHEFGGPLITVSSTTAVLTNDTSSHPNQPDTFNSASQNSDPNKTTSDVNYNYDNGNNNTQVVSSTTPKPYTHSQVHPLLIYSIRYEIRSYDLANSAAVRLGNQYSNYASHHSQDHPYQVVKNSRTLIAGLKNTIGLDFYYSESGSYIFWIDVIEERIYRGAIINGTITNVDMIIQTGLATAEGLAVDWIGHNIYWVESTLDHIEVANINGTSRRTLIAGDLESPRALAVDPRYGLLFWTDWDKRSPRIERATMSGEDRKVLVFIKDHKGSWPNGLTLDYDTLKIYWIDASSDSIHVVDYEGNNHQALLKQIKSLGHPFSITLFEDNLYWTDWKTNSVSMANKHNGSDARELQRLSNRLFDIKVFHPSRQPKIDDSLNPCSINNGDCSHLCLLSTNSTRKCDCPHLMKLKHDEKTCETDEHVLIIGRTNEIRVVDIDKPLYHIMAPISVPKVFHPRQFEFDAKSRSIFWADSQTNEVKRAQLIGNNIETIIDVIIESPSGLALDWISGNIYVSSASHQKGSGKIFISNLNGEYISILMNSTQGIISPKSLAVHPMMGFLFYVDETESCEPIINVARMDGSDRRAIVTKINNPKLDNPSNLAMDFELNRVYWINQASTLPANASIQYYDIVEDKVVTVVDESETLPHERINPTALCVDGNYLIISGRSVTEAIIKQSKHDLNDRVVHKTQNLDQITALKVYNASSQHGTNACSTNNGGCSQLCVPTNSTHRACKCTIGYNINPDNITECIGRDLFLIFSYNLGMRGISIEPNSSPDDYYLPPIHRAFRASSLDYVHRDNLIYWVDNEEGSITRINRDTTNHQVIVQGLESEECIGVDWIAGNIYWLDPYYHIIEVARLNGSNRYVIVSGDMDKANGLVINPIGGYIAWSDIGPRTKIETARLDGSNRRIVVDTHLGHIDDLAIDHEDDYIYWLDSTTALIERVKHDGTRRQEVFSGISYQEPHHFVSIAIYKEYLYIADSIYSQGSIIRVNKYNNLDRALIQQHLGDGIRDIAVFAEQPIPPHNENPCSLNNGGCQDLCLYLGNKGQKRCICSHGKLKSDGLTCEPYDKFILFSKFSQIDSLHISDDESHNNAPYPPIVLETRSNIIALAVDYAAQRIIYSEITRDQICSILFNGTDRRVLAEKQSLVEGVAFGNDELYWTSIFDNSISRLNTTSLGVPRRDCSSGECRLAGVEKLIRLGIDDKPRGIAIDLCTSYVYWTNWNADASIQRASPRNGYKVESIIKTNIKIPNGITIDQKQRKLYWCDARLDKIETCDMDGTNRVVLITASPQHPFAITVSDIYIFYTDWLARGVYRADKYTGQDHKLIKKVSQKPMGIAVVASDNQDCLKTHCTINNGDCPDDHACIQHSPGSGFINDVECRPQNQLAHELMLPASRCKFSRASDCDPLNYRRILIDTIDRYGFSATQPLVPQLTTPSTSKGVDIVQSSSRTTTKSFTPELNLTKSTNTNSSPHTDEPIDLYPTTTASNYSIHISSIMNTSSADLNTDSGNISLRTRVDIKPTGGSSPKQVRLSIPTTTEHFNQTVNSTFNYNVGPVFSTNASVSTSRTTLALDVTEPSVTTDSSVPSTTPQQVTSTPKVPGSDMIKQHHETTTAQHKSTLENQQISTSPKSMQDMLAVNSTSTTLPWTLNKVTTEPPRATSTPCQNPPTTDVNDNECKQPGQFKCYLSDKLICLSIERRCDGNYDCLNKEDENDCSLMKGSVQYNMRHEANWHRFVTVILIIFAAAVTALFLVFGGRGRRRWFLNKTCAFSYRRMFDVDNGTNIEISNPMFDEDDTGNLMQCAYSIDLNERTTNFSNPLYERQVLLMNDKNSTTS